jgi:hypothetical protein
MTSKLFLIIVEINITCNLLLSRNKTHGKMASKNLVRHVNEHALMVMPPMLRELTSGVDLG